MKKVIKKRTAQTVVPGKHLKLPSQKPSDIQLVDTDTDLLLHLARPNDFREGLSQLKQRFVSDVEELAGACDLDTEVKVYFTFKNHKE